MPWNGSGTFSRTNGTQTGSTTWANARDAGNNITASQHDTHDQDLADGINACLTKNGENGPTGNFSPANDDTSDLGIQSKRWQDLFLSGAVKDSSGNELIKFTSVASAVNEVTAVNAATGNSPTIAATGGDTNIALTLSGKGTGAVILGQATSTDVRLAADQPITDSSGNELLKFTKVASAVNELTLSNNSTGNHPTLSATGGDSSINITLTPKGTGTVSLPSVGGAGVATQANMESASATDLIVTPGRVKYSPNAAKWWAYWDSAGTLHSGTNVSSITDNATGAWTVNLTTAFSVNLHSTWATTMVSTAAFLLSWVNQVTQNIQFACYANFATGTKSDGDGYYNAGGFGDL